MELPVYWANYISIGGFLFLGILIWSIPKHLIYTESTDHARWRDIRIWATVLICIQISLYLLFA